MQQYDYDDGKGPDGRNDYVERSYIYNTQSLQIVDDAIFVVGKGGKRRIENFAVIPRIKKDPKTALDIPENFEFTSNSLAAKLINPELERYVDPSGIGRRVDIYYRDADKVLRGIYDNEMYNNDKFNVHMWDSFNGIRKDMEKKFDALKKEMAEEFAPVITLTPFVEPAAKGLNALADLNSHLFSNGVPGFLT